GEAPPGLPRGWVELRPCRPPCETGGARQQRAAGDRVVTRPQDRQRAVQEHAAGAGDRVLAALPRVRARRRRRDGDRGQHRGEQDAEEHDLMGYRTALAGASETRPLPDISVTAALPRVA